MDRKEEINKEIDSLETRIIVLRREYDDILKKENPVYVGDCFIKLRRIGNVYYKIVKITNKGNCCCQQVLGDANWKLVVGVDRLVIVTGVV